MNNRIPSEVKEPQQSSSTREVKLQQLAFLLSETKEWEFRQVGMQNGESIFRLVTKNRTNLHLTAELAKNMQNKVREFFPFLDDIKQQTLLQAIQTIYKDSENPPYGKVSININGIPNDDLDEALQAYQKLKIVDVVLILDTTGSMNAQLKTARETLEEIMKAGASEL